MAITTVDGAIAGARPPEEILKNGATMEAAGVMHSLFYTAGRPGAAVAPSPGLNGAALTTYAGQIPWTNPGAGNSYMFRVEASATLAGRLSIYDRLWHNSGLVVTTTTAQAITPVAIPARDINGATNGDGVMMAIEVSTATTNAGAVTNMTASYTNQAGTAGRTATVTSFPATAAAGTFVLFNLQAGDTGVRSVQSVTLGTSLAAGAVHIVLCRLLIGMPVPANLGNDRDVVTSGFIRHYDNTVPFLVWLPSATTAIVLNGSYQITQG